MTTHLQTIDLIVIFDNATLWNREIAGPMHLETTVNYLKGLVS